MSIESGNDVADALRRDGMPRAALIAVYGLAQQDAWECSQCAGFDHQPRKPVDLHARLGLFGMSRFPVSGW